MPRFGRRTAFFMLLFMATFLGVAIAFAPNYTVFTILRFVTLLDSFVSHEVLRNRDFRRTWSYHSSPLLSLNDSVSDEA